MGKRENLYSKIIETIFFERFEEGASEILFERNDISKAATKLKVKLPKNLGDVIYSFRYRTELPESVRSMAPEGKEWIIRSKGRSSYAFVATNITVISPSRMLTEIKIPDATPGVISKYALSDEQALLAKLRYNRLIDIFTGITCYSLQNHLRTTVRDMGQVETDEIYIGLDQRGAHYVFPVQAKGGKDRLGVVQIEQDMALCAEKFPSLVCRPVAAQFMSGDVIALMELELDEDRLTIYLEKHYRLVPPEEVTSEDLKTYLKRPN